MPEVACQECGGALPTVGRFCGRCGKRRDAPGSVEETGVTPARRSRSSVASAVSGSLLVAGLLAGGAAWMAAGRTPEVAPTEAASPGAAASVADGQRVSGAPARRVAATDLPSDIRCLVDDVPAPRAECASWAVATEAAAGFEHVATDDRIVVASTAADVTAFDAGTGDVRWRWRNPSGFAPDSIVLVGSRVVLTMGADHGLIALDGDTGAVAWSVPLVERRQAWIAVAAGGDGAGTARLVVREPTRLALLDPADGGTVFEVAVPAGGTWPVFVGSLVATAGEGRLHTWDAETGERAWQTDVDVDPLVPLISAERLVVAATTDGEVAAVDHAGTLRWRTALPGVLRLVALQDGTVAAVSRSGVDVLWLETGAVLSRVAIGGRVRDAVGAGPGELLVVTASTVQRIDSQLAGETWTLQASLSTETPAVALANTGWSQYVVATVDGGFVAAFEVLFTTPDHRKDPTCPAARRSEALGAFPAWQNDGAHAGLDFQHLPAGAPSQLWVGLFDAAQAQPVTVAAHRLDDGPPASLRSGEGEWATEITLGAGRTSPGWPTHWVAEARFPQSGCWEVSISAGDRLATVVIAVPQAAVDTDGARTSGPT